MSVAHSELVRWLGGVRREVERTNSRFVTLNPVRLPIPFFGDIRSARVLTIGVNPSSGEFNPESRWNAVLSDAQWGHRLLDYFHTSEAPWNRWFLPWEAALRLIGCSYENRTAAHLDLSPRATIRMSEAPTEIFRELVEADVRWLFEVLSFAPSARLVLVAGRVVGAENGSQRISDFLEAQAQSNNAALVRNVGTVRLVATDGRVSLPFFSFPSGPSADDKFKLVKDVFAVRKQLLGCLA